MDRVGATDRRIVAGIERALLDARGPDDLHARIFAEVGETMGLTGMCWHRTDPVSGVPVAGGRAGEPAGDFARSLEFEFLRPDYARFSDVMRRRRPMTALSRETHGQPDKSTRYREMIAPTGARDELRIAWVDPFGTWGTCTMFSDRLFDERTLAGVEAVRPAITRSLRLARTCEGCSALAPEHPGVLLLDGRDRLYAGDTGVQRLLAEAATRTGRDLTDTLTVLAALARRRDPAHPATARFRDPAGRWFTLDAVALDRDRRGEVAVVVQPATPDSVLEGLLRAYGLSARERQVASLVAAGRSNREVAARLRLSPWTVQDHVKHVYAKTGVRGRGELAALVVREAIGS